MSEQATIPNIDVSDVTLENTTTKVKFKIYPRDQNEPMIFNQVVIDEDMFSESITGTLLFNDPAYFIDQLNFSSFDLVKISFKKLNGPDSAYKKDIVFKITEVISNVNAISKITMGPAGAAIPIAIKFASNEIVYKNFNSSIENPFIGKISTGNSEASSSSKLSIETPYIDLGVQSNSLPGFVEYIFENFGKDTENTSAPYKKIKSDETFNGVWIKTNPSYYPWNKIGSASKISQLMNYMCEYACNQENPNAVNYFFWEDLDKFNFRCVESLIKEQEDKPAATYSPTLNEQDLDGIVSLTTIVETPIATLVNNGAFSGEFVRVKPNWANPYRNIVDTADSVERYQVVYDYYGDDSFKKIAPYPPLDLSKSIDMTVAYGPNRISDANYGFFQNAYSQKQNPWWNYWDPKYKGYEGAGGGGTDVDRIEDNYWQAQFDFCELPVTPLKIIYENIKWPLNAARANYAQLKRNKIKWSFYKNTILGERNMPISFYAILTGATKIYNNGPGGIWRYSFKEIEFFPKNRRNWVHINSPRMVSAATDFSGSQYPFEVLAPPWGIEGTAYNLNELLNTTLPSDKEKGDGQTAILSPGVSAKVVNGIVTDDSSYRKGYRMRPVGQFYIRSVKDDANVPSPTDTIYIGRIVKIDVIDSVMLDTMYYQINECGVLLPEEKGSASKIFIFDVENAHDGWCSA